MVLFDIAAPVFSGASTPSSPAAAVTPAAITSYMSNSSFVQALASSMSTAVAGALGTPISLAVTASVVLPPPGSGGNGTPSASSPQSNDDDGKGGSDMMVMIVAVVATLAVLAAAVCTVLWKCERKKGASVHTTESTAGAGTDSAVGSAAAAANDFTGDQ